MSKQRFAKRFCPVCSGYFNIWFVKRSIPVLHCHGCGLIRLDETASTMGREKSIYEGNDNIFIRDGNQNYYLDRTNFLSCREKLKWLKRHVPEGSRLLDVGANFGHFLKTVKGVYQAHGFDISDVGVEWSRKHFGVDNQIASIYDIPGSLRGPFDVVTCWDVIEHLTDPVTAVRRMWEVLKPGGLLLLSTPDTDSTVARLMGRHWHYMDPIQHRFLFSHQNLIKLLQQADYEIIGKCVFGHYYRLCYIFDRLVQLHYGGLLQWVAALMKISFFPLHKFVIYLKLGDVMGIAAQKRRKVNKTTS